MADEPEGLDDAETVKPTRRLFLAAGPAAAVFGALGAAAAAPAMADLTLDQEPILAAIARHKAAEAALTVTLNPVDEVYARLHGREITQADLDAHEAASAGEEAAGEDLLETVPVSWLGVQCALAYLAEFEDGFHLRDFIPTLLESPLFAAQEEA
jgi:hypothetical protein